MVKNNNRGESSICIAFTAIIVEHKESTGLLRHAPFAIIDRPCGRTVMFPRSALSCLSRRSYAEAHWASTSRSGK